MTLKSFGSRLVLVGLGVYLLVGCLRQVSTAAEWIRAGVAGMGDDPVTMRRRALGAVYTAGIEGIERAIPRLGSYWAVDADPGLRRELSWVRYDLAPRKGIYWGKIRGHRRLPESFSPQADPPDYVVISYGPERSPEAMTSDDFFRGAPHPRGREDIAILGSLDTPAASSTVNGPILVSGWSQGGQDPGFSSLYVYLDLKEVDPGILERYPRPDVTAAIPSMGNTDRAGFRARLSLPSGQQGEHDLLVILQTGDGRYRRLGPNVFRWTP